MRVIRRFLGYVEIMTKITSTFVFAMTIAFLLYKNQPIQWNLTIVFFASMFLFDLTTTAINNYIDTKNNHQTLQFKRRTALLIIYILFGLSTATGLYLAYLTDIVVLLAGAICFLCGVFYTYGPVPISRQPLGEVLSGIFYGLLIPFILMYINMPKGTFVTYNLTMETVSVELKLIPIFSLLLYSIVPFCATANIMLANNICDLEKDIAVKRHTLPYYIGNNALKLYAGFYYLSYLVIIVMVICKIISPICLLTLVTIILVNKNIKSFFKVQDKGVTFVLAVKNYMIIMGTNTILLFISVLLK